jgi:hypothetical protein
MTRILLILTAFSIFSISAHAQFKKNDILLGGQLSYSYNSSNQQYVNGPTYDNKATTGIFTINFGKALNENTIAGITLSYMPYSISNFNVDGTIPTKYHDNGYAAGIFYRKYKNLGKEFYLFGEVSALYNWSNESAKDSTGKEIQTGSAWSVGIEFAPGIAYKLSRHFFFELSLPDLINVGYSKSNTKTPQTNLENDQLNLRTSLSSGFLSNLGVGFKLIL